MKYLVYLSLAFLLFSSSLFAESNMAQKVEITIYSGLSFFDVEHETSPLIFRPLPFPETRETIEGGFLIGFKGGYYFNENFEIEGNFAISPNHDYELESGIFCLPGEPCPLIDLPVGRPGIPLFFDRRNLVMYNYDANFVYNFAWSNFRPFLTFGIGGVTTDFLDSSQNDFSFNFGGGAKFDFNGWGLRLEVNDHVIRDHFLSRDTEHDLQVQYGFAFRL